MEADTQSGAPAAPPAEPLDEGRAPLRPTTLIAVIVGIAVVYRALVYLAIGPLVAPSDDSTRYVVSALVEGRMFSDYAAPSGYPLFLAALHAIWAAPAAVSIVQHVLGLVAGAAMLAIGIEVADRTTVPRWAALIPGVVLLLGGDYLFFEQSIMTETLFVALLLPAILLVLRGERRSGRAAVVMYAGAGILLGVSVTVRTAGIPVAVLVIAWILLLGAGGWAARFRRTAAIAIPSLGVVVTYLVVASSTGDGRTGYGDYDGWNLYGRVAPFAQCREFDPEPPLTRLCERTPPDQRSGIFYYQYNPQSPALRLFGTSTRGDDQLRTFAIDAIVAQPIGYLRAVAKDTLRYIDPEFGAQRPAVGAGPEFMTWRTRTDPYPPRERIEELYAYQADTGPLFAVYESWLQTSRVPGIAWLVLALAALTGLVVGRAEERRLLVLLCAVVLAFMLVPVLTATYEYRFAVPAQGFGLLAGIMGSNALVMWMRSRSH